MLPCNCGRWPMGRSSTPPSRCCRRHAGVFFGVAIVCQGVPTALSLYVQFSGGAPQHFGLYLFSQLSASVGICSSRARRSAWSPPPTSATSPACRRARLAFGKIGRTLAAGLASAFSTGSRRSS